MDDADPDVLDVDAPRRLHPRKRYISERWGLTDRSRGIRLQPLGDVEDLAKKGWSKAVWLLAKTDQTSLQNPVLEAIIESSRSLVGTRASWEEADDDSVPTYAEQTWQRAAKCIRDIARETETLGAPMPLPEIHPGPDGSIDVVWKRQQFRLLIEIPPEDGTPVDFYGDDYGRNDFKGKMGLEWIPPSIAMWLRTHDRVCSRADSGFMQAAL